MKKQYMFMDKGVIGGDYTAEVVIKLNNDKSITVLDTKIYCPGDCNLGLPCQSCGSNGQYIGELVWK